MGFFLDALWRITTQTHHHIKWHCYDKPSRIKRGYIPDGLYPQERSHADQERLPQDHPEHREPAEPTPCAWKEAHGYCDCARMLQEKKR